jgi:LuxR family maltose regulon positive regulatory protein
VSASDTYVQTLLDAFPQEQRIKPNSPLGGLIEQLSARELEVLQLLAEGLSNKDIASKLVVAPSTIKQHLKNIFRKLDAHGRMQAVRRGRDLKLL